MSWITTPNWPRMIFSPFISFGSIALIMLLGMANPTPANWPTLVAMALFMPMTSPRMLTSGPPELPGLIGASVCRKSS